MFAIVGTVPDRDFPLAIGEALLVNGVIRIEGKSVPVNRGTPALLAAAIKTCKALDQPASWQTGTHALPRLALAPLVVHTPPFTCTSRST